MANIRGRYALSSVTGTIAAALGANSAVFAMRNAPGDGKKNLILTSLVVDWATIVAFTTAITAGRRLALYRGSGAAAAGGTALATAAKKITSDPASQVDSAQGGDARIATTGALTVAGITFEAQEFATLLLAGQGAAGAVKRFEYRFDAERGTEHYPVLLKPGELLAIRNPQAMDAAGTWQISVDAAWEEV